MGKPLCAEKHRWHFILQKKPQNLSEFRRCVADVYDLVDFTTNTAVCAHCGEIVIPGIFQFVADLVLKMSFALTVTLCWRFVLQNPLIALLCGIPACIIIGVVLWWLRKMLYLVLPWRRLRYPLNDGSVSAGLVLKVVRLVINLCFGYLMIIIAAHWAIAIVG